MRLGDYDTGDDWGLFCTSISIEAPEVQKYQVEVPGRNGLLDLSDALFDEPKFYNRALTFVFAAPGLTPQDWRDLLSDMSGKLHGRSIQIILDDDPDWYYTGVIEISSDEDSGEITVTTDAYPYKLAVNETTYEIDGSQTVALTNDILTATPTVTVTAETMITVGDSSLSLSAGTYYLTDFEIPGGGTEWEIETDGTVTITYRQGRL